MTRAASTMAAYQDALATALRLRVALDGVEVSAFPLGADTRDESIQMGSVLLDEAWAALGKRQREEQYTIKMMCWAIKPGTVEDGSALAARDRALVLYNEVAEEVTTTPRQGVDLVLESEMVEAEFEQGAASNGRWCQVTFQVTVKARL